MRTIGKDHSWYFGWTTYIVRDAAATRGVEVVPLSRYASRPLDRDGLLLGFAAVDAAEIRRGVKELAAIFRQAPVRNA